MLGFLMTWDPVYLLGVMLPATLLALWAQFKVKSAYAQMSRRPVSSGMTGAQAAQRILEAHGIHHVGIEPARGFLSDHYDPRHKVLRLSPDVYHGRSIASVGIAAHEVGHAIQDASNYTALVVRNGIVPLANLGGSLSMGILFVGFILQSTGMIAVGIALFSLLVLFQIVNLPVEFNASSRARAALVSSGVIVPAEEPLVGKVLNAAAMTYVAATIGAILQLLYFLMRSGLLGGRRE
ncbi:MAG: hypothetical protein FLDDKLPJ_01884 [Phycisphaerae bacterium]|nr:hypothetical protein [Phycisphaerae bacterium]